MPACVVAPVPRISVIVPVWNVEDHVGACLGSLAAQGFADFEAIVVDDGATDASLARARAAVAGDGRFRFLSQPNQGLSAARNTGLAAARGAFVAFLDSDDRVHPDWLGALHAALEGSGADWVACAIRFVNATGPDRVHPAIHGAPPAGLRAATRAAAGGGAEDALRFALDDWRAVIRHYPSAWNKLYRRSLIGDVRFDVGMSYEDHAFFWQLAARTDHLLWLPRPLYLQTQGRAGQITRDGGARVFQQIAVLDRLAGIAAAADRPGAAPALARIATRLGWERCQSLTDPDRQARFVAACRDWFARHGLTPQADWDAAIGRAWPERLAGRMPLSVVVTTDGLGADEAAQASALAATLNSLAAQSLRHMEVVVVPADAGAAALAARLLPAARVLPPPPSVLHSPAPPPFRTAAPARSGSGPDSPAAGAPACPPGPARAAALARGRGLAAARGEVVTFLAAGARLLHPDALAGRLEAMLQADAAVALAAACGPAPEGNRPGRTLATFHDARPCRPGPLTLDAATAQALQLLPETLMLRRSLLTAPPAAPVAAAAGTPPATRPPDTRPDHAAPCAPLGPGRLRAALARAGPDALLLGPVDVMLPRSRSIHWTGVAESRISRGEAPSPGTETGMLRFFARDGGSLSYDVDFRTHPYANISFFDASGRLILFHLSLRLKEWLAVSNRRLTERWEDERPLPVMLEETGDRVEIRFPARDRVEVLINGEELVAHEGSFDRLDEIVAADVQGGVVLETLETSGAHNRGRSGMGALQLTGPLRLEGWAFDPQGGAQQQLGLLVGSSETIVPVLAHDRRDLAARIEADTPRIGLATILPGRVWQGLPELAAGAPDPLLRLQATSNGVPCGAPLTLHRSDIVQRIEAIAAGKDPTDLLAAIEHVRFGQMWPLLSPAARDALQRAAETYKVRDFLFPGEPPEDVAAALSAAAPAAADARPPVPGQARMERNLRRLMADCARRLRGACIPGPIPGTSPDATAEPAALLKEIRPQLVLPELRRRLLLELTDTFCARDIFPVLFAEARAEPPVTFSAEIADNAWAASLVAPFLYMQGDITALHGVLWSLSRPLPAWLCTPALAWLVRDAVTTRSVPLDPEARDDIIYTFMAVIDRERRDYDGRSPCVELIRSMVTLLGLRMSLPEYLRRDLVACALRAYGLSRGFWAAFEAAAPPPAPRLEAGHAAFAAISAMVAGGDAARRDPARRQAAEAALRLFAAAGNSDVARVRLDLFGPAGLIAATGEETPSQPGLQPGALPLPPMPALLAEGLDPEEATLRHFAAPGAGPVPEPLRALTRRAVGLRHGEEAAPDPLAEVVERASRAAAALLAGIGAQGGDAEAAAGIAPLMNDIAAVATARSGYVGLGLGLRLLHGLLRLGAATTAAAVLHGLDGLCRRLPDPASAAGAPAVVNALWALRRFEAGIAATPDAPREVRAAADLAGVALLLLPEALPEVEALPLPAADAAAGLTADPRCALFDTLVVVLSCRPYLDSRVSVLEAGWLARLEALGIPWVVAVGGAEGASTLQGRVLHLAAPDDYEGLPLKTLEMLRWVHDHTGFAHVLKIDDDCLLDPEAAFHVHSHTVFDYHGRRIDRRAGDMDRQWHIAKSASDHGRLQIDKSPEPASYCDGGAGYTLGRRALAGLEAARMSPEGETLISVSLMEDKLVGDLLARRGIRPRSNGYRMAILRRSRGGGTPVPRWSDSFLPGPASGVRLVHLDSTEGQAEALETLDSGALRPPKIWPTLQASRLVYNANALTLMSPPERLARAAAAPVAVVACLRNEADMLPIFLAHYRALGIEGFLVVDNGSDDGTLEMLLAEPDVAVFHTDTEYSAALYGVAWQQALLAHYRTDRWTVVADADELLVCDLARQARLPDLLAGPDFAGAEAVRLFMLDMYPQGPLSDADFASGDPFAEAGHVDRAPFLAEWLGMGPHSDSPTWTSALRHRLFPGSRPELFVAQKIALLRYRPWMRLSAGLHYVADVQLAERAFILAHFKYNAAFHAKARTEVARGQHFNAAEEYRRYLALVDGGRQGLFDPELSVPWQDCAVVRDLLSAGAGTATGAPARRRNRRR